MADSENPNAWSPDAEQRALLARVQQEKEAIQNQLTTEKAHLRDANNEIKTLKAKLTAMGKEKGLSARAQHRRSQVIARFIEQIDALQRQIARQNTAITLLAINQGADCKLCPGVAGNHDADCSLFNFARTNKISVFNSQLSWESAEDDEEDNDY